MQSVNASIHLDEVAKVDEVFLDIRRERVKI